MTSWVHHKVSKLSLPCAICQKMVTLLQTLERTTSQENFGCSPARFWEFCVVPCEVLQQPRFHRVQHPLTIRKRSKKDQQMNEGPTWSLIPLSKWVSSPQLNKWINPTYLMSITGVISHLRFLGWATKYGTTWDFCGSVPGKNVFSQWKCHWKAGTWRRYGEQHIKFIAVL